jgi:hypothetical protein
LAAVNADALEADLAWAVVISLAAAVALAEAAGVIADLAAGAEVVDAAAGLAGAVGAHPEAVAVQWPKAGAGLWAAPLDTEAGAGALGVVYAGIGARARATAALAVAVTIAKALLGLIAHAGGLAELAPWAGPLGAAAALVALLGQHGLALALGGAAFAEVDAGVIAGVAAAGLGVGAGRAHPIEATAGEAGALGAVFADATLVVAAAAGAGRTGVIFTGLAGRAALAVIAAAR